MLNNIITNYESKATSIKNYNVQQIVVTTCIVLYQYFSPPIFSIFYTWQLGIANYTFSKIYTYTDKKWHFARKFLFAKNAVCVQNAAILVLWLSNKMPGWKTMITVYFLPVNHIQYVSVSCISRVCMCVCVLVCVKESVEAVETDRWDFSLWTDRSFKDLLFMCVRELLCPSNEFYFTYPPTNHPQSQWTTETWLSFSWYWKVFCSLCDTVTLLLWNNSITGVSTDTSC